MTNQRILYYTPWHEQDGLMHACGITYSGIDEKTKQPKFDKFLTGNYIMEVETSASAAHMFTVVFILIISSSNGTNKFICGLNSMSTTDLVKKEANQDFSQLYSHSWFQDFGMDFTLAIMSCFSSVDFFQNVLRMYIEAKFYLNGYLLISELLLESKIFY